MRDFVFENATRVYFGAGCVGRHLAEALAPYGPCVMLGWGGGSAAQNGALAAVRAVLAETGRRVVDFSGITPNPTYDKVLEGAEMARREGAHLILAVGGGSVIDCCKAVAMGAVYEGDLWADFWARRGTVDFEPLPLGAVVTLAATGSEVNGGAVITHTGARIKTDRDYPACNPRFALLDPTYTFSVPRWQTAAGGFDILSHIMEAYFSPPDGDNLSDDLAEALMGSVVRNLPAALANPRDYEARSNLMWAAALAENRMIKMGKSLDFQAHHIEHQLSAYTDCNHGAGLAVISPAYYRQIYPHGLQKFGRFAKNVWGLSGEGLSDDQLARAGIEALASFIGRLGLPATLRELGVADRGLLGPIARSCEISTGRYKRLTHADIEALLEACY